MKLNILYNVLFIITTIPLSSHNNNITLKSESVEIHEIKKNAENNLNIEKSLIKYYKAFKNIETYENSENPYSYTLKYFHGYLGLDSYLARKLDYYSFKKYHISSLKVEIKILNISTDSLGFHVIYNALYKTHLTNGKNKIFSVKMKCIIDIDKKIKAIAPIKNFILDSEVFFKTHFDDSIADENYDHTLDKISVHYYLDNTQSLFARILDIDDDGKNELMILRYTGGMHGNYFIEFYKWNELESIYIFDKSIDFPSGEYPYMDEEHPYIEQFLLANKYKLYKFYK